MKARERTASPLFVLHSPFWVFSPLSVCRIWARSHPLDFSSSLSPSLLPRVSLCLCPSWGDGLLPRCPSLSRSPYLGPGGLSTLFFPRPRKSGANSRHGAQCECNLETPSGLRTPDTPGEAAKGQRCHPRLDYASTSWATLVKVLPLSEPCSQEELLDFKCPQASGLFSLVVPSPL